MKIITSINAKGGCGKSTIAMSVAAGLARAGFATLLIDMDPQAQITQWLGAGDGLSDSGTLVEAITGLRPLADLIQPTRFTNLWFVASSEGLEELGRQITDREDYAMMLTRVLAPIASQYAFLVIDSPNQISPVMANAIYPTDVFIVPFESTKAVRSYANFLQLLLRLRPDEEHKILHVLSNLTRQPGLRKRVIQVMELHGIPGARSEIRTCGWLAQVDEHGGSIFAWRPHSKGTADMNALLIELLETLGEAVPPAIREGHAPPTPAVIASGEVPALGTYLLKGNGIVQAPTDSPPTSIPRADSPPADPPPTPRALTPMAPQPAEGTGDDPVEALFTNEPFTI
ncbi:MAG TPA: ParA family protein [Tepidisphaeraceae bacterium]|jgi:chromosome partitioning protein|nr:ParA family protein [Tepidisphaeraceae bacterium]